MDFLISNAYAQDAASTGGLMGFLPLILIFVVFYFMLIRPQMKRAKDHRNMVSSLSKGDEVVTNGGILGKITDLGDSFVTLQLADYALLMGSIGLTLILGATMYFTRKINWYKPNFETD